MKQALDARTERKRIGEILIRLALIYFALGELRGNQAVFCRVVYLMGKRHDSSGELDWRKSTFRTFVKVLDHRRALGISLRGCTTHTLGAVFHAPS